MFKNVTRSRGPFLEDVDGDSVASDTTEESEQEDVFYSVDQILAEDRDYDGMGELRYLLKWTGYAITRASWEPTEHIETESVLREWEKRKRRIRQGELEAFDLEVWDAKRSKLEEEKLERARRRKAKRRRRGIAVSSSSDEADDDDAVDVGASPNRKRFPRPDSDDGEAITAGESAKRQRRVKAAPVKRKGVAQKVSSASKYLGSSSAEDGEVEEPPNSSVPGSDPNSLFDEGSQPIYPDVEKTATPRARPTAKVAPLVKPPTSAPKVAKLVISQKAAAVPDSKQASQPRSTVDKAVGSAKRTKTANIFASFADPGKKRKQRARVSGETPKDSVDPKFRNLSQLNRFQKFSKNERAPDINAVPLTSTTPTGDVDPRRGLNDREALRLLLLLLLLLLHHHHHLQITANHIQLLETAETCNFAHYNIDANDTLPQFVPEIPGSAVQPVADTTNTGMEPGFTMPFRGAEDPTAPIADTPHISDSIMDRTVRFQLPQNEAPPEPFVINVDPGVASATMEVICGSAAERVKVYANLHVSRMSKIERLFYPITKGIHLMPDSMITAKDVQAYLADSVEQSAQWPAGSIAPVEISRREADAVAECCKLHASGLVAMQDNFTLLLYPARDDEWRFLERPNVPTVPNAPLRFQFMPPLEGRGHKQAAADGSSVPPAWQRPSVTVAKDMLNIDARNLLVEKEGRQADTSVFLAWPQEHEAELQILVKCFQDLNCKVYHSGTPGAWQYYRRKYNKSCLILVHPDTPLWEIPRLHSMLQNGGVRMFSIGLQLLARQSLEDPAVYHCERLFPFGKVTFITDEVFVNHPEKASQVIQLFLENNKVKPPGGENDKIAARPGVKDWLRQLATERTTERGRNDNRWLQLYYDICQLCPPEDEDPYDLPNPSPTSHLVSLPPQELPSFIGLWEHDPDAATDAMVEWFAGWSVLNANKFRKFLVCHEPQKGTMVTDENGQSKYHVDADPRGWAKRWQHIDVQRPETIGRKPKGGK
ncbi:hypothetical protein B0A55_07372 [Friedmanniomyces simplex]|uniref:Chromo domain-containing protein n=1 Tax=Friedmanniomyces simplex TaxID=329884 RepID=A0A4U0X119_9PEZI|nr:hypothetical protein B0A55_07372 [Friedmanniomyces simplex]